MSRTVIKLCFCNRAWTNQDLAQLEASRRENAADCPRMNTRGRLRLSAGESDEDHLSCGEVRAQRPGSGAGKGTGISAGDYRESKVWRPVIRRHSIETNASSLLDNRDSSKDMKSSVQTLAILVLSSAFVAAQNSGPGNGAGAGPLSTTPGTSQAPAQNNPPDQGQQPQQGERRRPRRARRKRKIAAPVPMPIPPAPGRRATGTARLGTAEILGCHTTVLLNPLLQHKIRHHKRQSKVLLLRAPPQTRPQG